MNACCAKVDIVSNSEVLEFDGHQYQVRIVYCKNCGSEKATSYIKRLDKSPSG